MSPLQKAIELLGGPTKTATALGVSAQAVCFWRDGKRQFPLEHCPRIEVLTDGAVTRRELRPADWQAIWPELAANDAQNQPPALANSAQGAMESVAATAGQGA